MDSQSSRKYLTKEEFEARAAEMLKESATHKLVEMSDEDARLMEELLDLEKGTLPKFTCRFEKGTEHCPNCGRHYSVLDKAKTGLGIHDKKFMAEAVIGKHGDYVWNEKTQPHNCYNCGHPSIMNLFYINRCYGCSG